MMGDGIRRFSGLRPLETKSDARRRVANRKIKSIGTIATRGVRRVLLLKNQQ